MVNIYSRPLIILVWMVCDGEYVLASIDNISMDGVRW